MSDEHRIRTYGQSTSTGYYYPFCTCGEACGPEQDLEAAIDALMAHAFDAGAVAGRVTP